MLIKIHTRNSVLVIKIKKTIELRSVLEPVQIVASSEGVCPVDLITVELIKNSRFSINIEVASVMESYSNLVAFSNCQVN